MLRHTFCFCQLLRLVCWTDPIGGNQRLGSVQQVILCVKHGSLQFIVGDTRTALPQRRHNRWSKLRPRTWCFQGPWEECRVLLGKWLLQGSITTHETLHSSSRIYKSPCPRPGPWPACRVKIPECIHLKNDTKKHKNKKPPAASAQKVKGVVGQGYRRN